MTILALALSAVLIVVAAIHLLWAIGYWFPIPDETALVRAVIGFKTAERMPGPIPCALVTVGLLTVTTAIWWPPGGLRTAIVGAAALVFLARGAAPWLKFWRRLATLEPFATYDRRYYGPLCLAIGVGFAALWVLA